MCHEGMGRSPSFLSMFLPHHLHFAFALDVDELNTLINIDLN